MDYLRDWMVTLARVFMDAAGTNGADVNMFVAIGASFPKAIISDIGKDAIVIRKMSKGRFIFEFWQKPQAKKNETMSVRNQACFSWCPK